MNSYTIFKLEYDFGKIRAAVDTLKSRGKNL